MDPTRETGTVDSGPGEWLDWHRQYDRDGPLAERLRLVRAMIARALTEGDPGRLRLLSLCAGQGRDVLGALEDHPRAADVEAVLVERDPSLAATAREAAARLRAGSVRVVEGDAGYTDTLRDGVPANVLVVCGVFGNIDDLDVQRTVHHLPELCAARATVVWTRGRFEPDLTSAVRAWFRSAGFEEIEFLPIPGSTAAVGVHRLVRPPDPFRGGERWFSFLPPDERPSHRRSSAP